MRTFLKKVFDGHMSFFFLGGGGALVSLFWIFGDISSGFQSQSGFCLIRIFAEANIMYILRDPPLVLQ